MVQCPKCYSEVDERATVCKHCGKKIKTKPGERFGNYVIFLGLVFALIAFYVGGVALAVMVLLAGIIAGGLVKKLG